MPKETNSEVKDRIKLCRARYTKCVDFDKENRQKSIDDMKFIHEPGYQWDQYTKAKRGKRPMYQFNRSKVTVARIVNDMRANRPQGKVRGTEDGDKDTAEVIEGLCRNIANVSDFESITDNAAMYQVGGGYAAWRIDTEYSHNTAFDQDIVIRGFRNSLCVYGDPNGFDMVGADCKYWLVTDWISVDSFKERWPKAKKASFDGDEFDDSEDWSSEEEGKVRICEHWFQVPTTKTIFLLSDGKTIDDTEIEEAKTRGLTVVKQREVSCYKIQTAIYSGDAELEAPSDWAGEYFPFVRVYGEYLIIDGKVEWCGLTRHIKDAQRAFNVMMTSAVETVALAPQSKIWATADQAKGLASSWAEAHETNLPYMIYNADAKALGAPGRVGGAEVPVALIQMAQINADEIKADSGIFDSSLGAQSNETSGRAINARQRQGEIATFHFQDNMAKGVRRTWQILIDLIPKIIDTTRAVRILGADLSDKYIKVNEPGPDGKVLNDLARGKYDVTVTVGPSFSTQRQEAVEAYTQIAQTNPAIYGVAGDLLFKAMDLPLSDQIAERMKSMLPPQIQEQMKSDKPLPPEVQQAMMQVDQAMQQVQQHGQLVKAAEAELEQMKGEDAKRKAELQGVLSDIAVKKAEFDSDVTKSLADIAVKQAAFMVKQQMALTEQDSQAIDQEREQLREDVQNALALITNHAEGLSQEMQHFAGLASSAIGEVHENAQRASVPRKKTISAKRVNGKLVAQITDEDGSTRQAEIARNNGELTGTIQ